jgi:hypothetical protein
MPELIAFVKLLIYPAPFKDCNAKQWAKILQGMAGHNPRCQEEDTQEAEGAVGNLVCQAKLGQEASQEAQDQEQRRHCTTTTLAAPDSDEDWRRCVVAANVAGCIMILLLMMMRTRKPTQTPVVQQIWKAAIHEYLCLIGSSLLAGLAGSTHYSSSDPLTLQLPIGSRFSIGLYKAFVYILDYNLDLFIEKTLINLLKF